MNWQENILSSAEQIRDLILQTKRIAVLGIKTDAQADQPSVYVPLYMQKAGFEIVPVPVYYPEATEILGKKVYRKLATFPARSIWSMFFAALPMSRVTSMTSWQRNQIQFGFSPASATTPLRRFSPRRESKSCRIAV